MGLAMNGGLMSQANSLMDTSNPFNAGSSLAKLLQPSLGGGSAGGGGLNPSSFAIDPIEQSLASLEQNIKCDPDPNRAMLAAATAAMDQSAQFINELSGGGAGSLLSGGKTEHGTVEELHQQLADLQHHQFMAMNAAAAAASGGGSNNQFDLMGAQQAAMMSAMTTTNSSSKGHHNGSANGFNSMDNAILSNLMNSASMFEMQQQQMQFPNNLMGHNKGQGIPNSLPSPLAMGGQQQQIKKEEKFLLMPKPIEQLIMPQHQNAMQQEMHMQQSHVNGGDKRHSSDGMKGGQAPNFVQAFSNKLGAPPSGGGDLKNASGWSSLASNSPQNANSSSNNLSAMAMNANGPVSGGGGAQAGSNPVPTSMPGNVAGGGGGSGANGGSVSSGNNGGGGVGGPTGNSVGGSNNNGNSNNGSGGAPSGGNNSNGNNNSGHQMPPLATVPPGPPSAGNNNNNSGGTPTAPKPKSAMDSFQAFRTKAKEKMDRQKYLEQQEFKRIQKEAADKEMKRLQEQQQQQKVKRPDEVDSR